MPGTIKVKHYLLWQQFLWLKVHVLLCARLPELVQKPRRVSDSWQQLLPEAGSNLKMLKNVLLFKLGLKPKNLVSYSDSLLPQHTVTAMALFTAGTSLKTAGLLPRLISLHQLRFYTGRSLVSCHPGPNEKLTRTSAGRKGNAVSARGVFCEIKHVSQVLEGTSFNKQTPSGISVSPASEITPLAPTLWHVTCLTTKEQENRVLKPFKHTICHIH